MEQINFKLKGKCGIYSIFNYNNGKCYIGSSKDIYNRWHEHYHNLKNNKSHNEHLQNAWNKYGEENFRFNVLEFCDEDIRFEREQYYIDTMLPKYNFAFNVEANFNRVISDSQCKQISETLKEKYASGKLTPHIRTDLYYDTYVYNIIDFTFCGKFQSIRDTAKALGVNRDTISRNKIIGRIYCDQYIITEFQINFKNDLKNYFYKNFVKAKSKTDEINYIIGIKNNDMIYYRSYASCAKDLGCSVECLRQHKTASLNNPYIIKKSNYRYFTSKDFISFSKDMAVPIEESSELLSGNIGEKPEKENPEINSETKESESSYSVECEPCDHFKNGNCTYLGTNWRECPRS